LWPKTSEFMTSPKRIAVSASFDDLRSPQVRFLEEAAKLGEVSVRLWSDETVHAVTGKDTKFPQAERLYVVQALRYVRDVQIVNGAINPDTLPLDLKVGRDSVEPPSAGNPKSKAESARRTKLIQNPKLPSRCAAAPTT